MLAAHDAGTGAKGGLITMPQEKHILQIIVDAEQADTILVGYMIVLT